MKITYIELVDEIAPIFDRKIEEQIAKRVCRKKRIFL